MNSESNITKKIRDESQPSPCKKRRRSHKGSISEDIPFKRGRKPNRSRHNSDSDDTSEHSMPGNVMTSNPSLEPRFRRSPMSRKYNFYVDFGKYLKEFFNIKVCLYSLCINSKKFSLK